MLIISVSLYFMVLGTIGWLVSRSLHSTSAYLLADRQLPAPLVALGVGASDMSGWLMMALPGLCFTSGSGALWMPLALLVGSYVNWRLLAKRLRPLTDYYHALSLPTFIERRLMPPTATLKVFMSLLMVVFFVIYMTAALVSAATVWPLILPLSYSQALCLSWLVILAYTILGGFLAINWIDFFQGMWILCCLWLVPGMVWWGMDPSKAVDFTQYTTLWDGMGWMAWLSLVTWGLGYWGQPHILMRFMAIDDPRQLVQARRVAITWMMLSLLGAMCTGWVGRMWLSDGTLAQPETIFLEMARVWFHPMLAGWVLASVLSAIISTATAQLLTTASVVVEDLLPSTSYQLSPSNRLRLSRWTVLLLATLAVLLAWAVPQSILSWVSLAWSGLGATLGPVVLLSLYRTSTTHQGVLAGMGSATVVWLFWVVMRWLTDWSWFELYELLPAFLVNAAVITIVSHCGPVVQPKVTHQFKKSLQSMDMDHSNT